jgi:3'-phosphoadenosine 5'-phosphosulfate (PAPS) 3'-phosphatase
MKNGYISKASFSSSNTATETTTTTTTTTTSGTTQINEQIQGQEQETLQEHKQDVQPTGEQFKIKSQPLQFIPQESTLLRAIISKSRAGGMVQKCIDSLSSKNLLHAEPLYITGAGYKTMKLVIGQNNEGLWFFPKPGTFLWDVAAADALLRVMGGRISDRFGKDLDYHKDRMDAENLNGIIACSDENLHCKCVELYLNENWDEDNDDNDGT